MDVQQQPVAELQEQVFAVRDARVRMWPSSRAAPGANRPCGLETARRSPAKTSPNWRASRWTECPSGIRR